MPNHRRLADDSGQKIIGETCIEAYEGEDAVLRVLNPYPMIKKATKGLVVCAVILGIISPGAIIAQTPSITKAGANVTLAATDHYDMADGSNVMIFKYDASAENGQGQTEYSIDFTANVMADVLVVGGGGGPRSMRWRRTWSVWWWCAGVLRR